MGVTGTVRDLTGTARGVVRVARDSNLTFMAAAIAHYTLASLVPLLLLALALATLVGGEALVQSFIEERLASVLSGSGRQILANALTGVEGQVGAGIVGIVLAVWSGSKTFRGLSVAFAELYGDRSTPSLVEQLRNGVLVMTLLALAVAAIIGMGIVVSFVSLPVGHPILASTAVLFLTLVVGLLPIYYVLTPRNPTVREVLPGTVLAAGGLIALQVAFLYYARYADKYEALGVLGAVLLFVMWLYFGGVLLLLGGALNYVLRYSPE